MVDGKPAECHAERLEGGDVLRLLLDEPKGNILGSELVEEMLRHLQDAPWREIKVLIVAGKGGRFSYGASIEEHLPEQIGAFLRRFHRLLRCWLTLHRPTIAVVEGPCLGGGLELALACQRIIAHPDASFGQPEIRLGVFAPVASLLLPERVGQRRAEDLLLDGHRIHAAEALELGLVDRVTEDPMAAALEEARERWLPQSTTALHFALRAARWSANERFLRHLEGVERLYLDELMRTADAEEGVRAFLDKRRPLFMGFARRRGPK